MAFVNASYVCPLYDYSGVLTINGSTIVGKYSAAIATIVRLPYGHHS